MQKCERAYAVWCGNIVAQLKQQTSANMSKRTRTDDASMLPEEIISIIYEFIGMESAFDVRLISHDFDLTNNDKIWDTLAKQKDWKIPTDQTAFQFCLHRMQVKRQIEKYLNFIRPLIHSVRPPNSPTIAILESFTLPYDLEAFYELSSGISFEGIDGFTINIYDNIFPIYDPDDTELLHRGDQITTKWLIFGEEAEYANWLICCDPKNPDFGCVSFFINNLPEGEFVFPSLLEMFSGMYKMFKKLQQHFSDKEILFLVENGCARSGSDTYHGGVDALELLKTMRSWKDSSRYVIDRDRFFEQTRSK